MKEKPYIETKVTTTEQKYNPNFGDNRICECGHVYGRHFDSYEDMYPCGCKYCSCRTFVGLREDIEKLIKDWKAASLKANNYRMADVTYKNGWFMIHGDPTRFRKVQVIKFIERLLESKME